MRVGIHTAYLSIIIALLCFAYVGQAKADYPGEVMADNPMLYFRFEDAGTGDGVDDDGWVGRGGTYVGDSITGVPGAPGTGIAVHFGQATTASGAGDCVDVWDGDYVFGLPDVTYEAWILIQPGELAYSRIFQHNGDWLNEGGPGVMMNTWQYGVIGGDTCDYMDAPTDDALWHHVVATFESGASTLKNLYVDGSFVASATGPNDLRYTFDRITVGGEGNRWWIYNHLKGAVDEFAVYEGALGEDRILVHYQEGITPEPATLALLGLGGLALIRKRR